MILGAESSLGLRATAIALPSVFVTSFGLQVLERMTTAGQVTICGRTCCSVRFGDARLSTRTDEAIDGLTIASILEVQVSKERSMLDHKQIRIVKRANRNREEGLVQNDQLTKPDPVSVVTGWIEEFRENQRKKTQTAIRLFGMR